MLWMCYFNRHTIQTVHIKKKKKKKKLAKLNQSAWCLITTSSWKAFLTWFVYLFLLT
jgi:hypothetical protein